MGDPHNPKRIGETWNVDRIQAQLTELALIKNLAIISGGWAWHFMSPPNHKEIKIQHDHKDIDIFISPNNFEALRDILVSRSFVRAKTQYDNPGQFYRYTKLYDTGKIVFDIFLEEAPFVYINGFKIVEPRHLISLYSNKHTSRECIAVVEAKKLLASNINNGPNHIFFLHARRI